VHWQAELSKLAYKDLVTAECQQDTWNRYLMLEFNAAHIPWNVMSSHALRHIYITWTSLLVPQFGSTISKLCWIEYSLTMYAFQQQLRSRTQANSDQDRWTSTTTVTIMSGIVTLFCVDFVNWQNVGCWKIWTTWRQAASFMSKLVCWINLNKAKSAFGPSLH